MRFLIFLFLLLVAQISEAQIENDYPPGYSICSDTIQGDNIGFTPDDTISYTFFCGEVENSSWYTFKTGEFDFVEFTLTILSSKTGDGLEMGIFDEDLIPVSNCFSLKDTTSIIARVSLNKYQKYHIMIDGIDGDECEYELALSDLAIILPVIKDTICNQECALYFDSCYSEPGVHLIDTKLKNSIGCDSLVRLRLFEFGIFPSAEIECHSTNDSIIFNWPPVFGAASYRIFVNRDSFATINTTSFLLENIEVDSMVSIKIQPIGRCIYLPAETSCINTISKVEIQNLENEILVFPNPTTGSISIETDLIIEAIEIFNSKGQFLQKEKTTSFELKNLESGIYFLKIKTNEGVGVKRILVSSQ